MSRSLTHEEALKLLESTTNKTNESNNLLLSLVIGTVTLGITGFFGKYSIHQDCSILSFNQAIQELNGWQCSVAVLSTGLISEGLFLMIIPLLASSYNIITAHNFNNDYNNMQFNQWTHIENLTNWHYQMQNYGFQTSLLDLNSPKYELIDGSLFGFNCSSMIYNFALDSDFVVQHGLNSSRLFMVENDNKYIFKGYICPEIGIKWSDLNNLENPDLNVNINDDWSEDINCNDFKI
jgi:hypothetical protein